MFFLTTSLLAGIGLIAVPIALHLVMRRRPRHLEFPALRFLQARAETNRRQLQLRHLLLLLLRCAVIGLLAFALARPSLRGSGVLGGQEAPVAAALLFDTSPSMDYLQENETRLDVARQLGDWLLNQLPDDSDVAVLTLRSGADTFAVNRSAAKQRIERIRTSPVAWSLDRRIEEAVQLVVESQPNRKEVYVLTDMTQSAWGESEAIALAQRLAEESNVAIYLVDVGVDRPRNMYLADLRLTNESLTAGRPLRIETSLVATASEGSRDVELWLDGVNTPSEKRGQQTVTWQAGSRQQLTFEVGSLTPGTHQGYLRIVGEDGLAFDDRRFFTVEVNDPLPVLIATGAGAESIYLRSALGAGGFDCQVVPLDALSQQMLADFSVVCLLDPSVLDDATIRALVEFVEQGGGLAVFLGRNAQRDAMNAAAAERLLPGRLKRYAHDAGHLSPTTLQHRLLAPFRRFAGEIPWSDFPVLTYWQFESIAADVQVVLPFVGGGPALLEHALGSGRVLTMTTPVSDPANRRDRQPWNVLPTGFEPWPFTLLTAEMMTYLAGADADRLNYWPGETAVLRVPTTAEGSMFLLSTPQGDAMRQSIDPRRQSVVVTTTDELGNYQIRSGGAEAGLRRGFSVNVPAAMSRLERISSEDLARRLGKDRYRVASSRQQLEDRVSTGRVGLKLFPYIMMFVALALGLEHVLSNRFYKNK